MDAKTITPDQALQMLIAGNRRYTSSNAVHPNQTLERRLELMSGQHPFAVILTCSDSRVPPEVFFDVGIGDIYVIRNAGNIVDEVVLGSIEHAVEHLGVPLVLVLGHTRCGAVTAAVKGEEVHGHFGSIVAAIQPAVEAAKTADGDEAVQKVVMENARRMADKIRTCEPILAEAVRQKRLVVASGFYRLNSGVVNLL